MSHYPRQTGLNHYRPNKKQPSPTCPIISRPQLNKFPCPSGSGSSSYHGNYPYPYPFPHPPSLMSEFNHYCMPPYPSYYPFPYPPTPPMPYSEQKRKEKRVKKQVIDLEDEPEVKRQFEEVVQKALSPDIEKTKEKLVNEEHVFWLSRKNRNKGNSNLINQPSQQYDLKTNTLQKIFKKLVEKITKNPKQCPVQDIKKQFAQKLREENQLDQPKQRFLELIISVLVSKFQSFKKTKQEIIKYIIRRTYHNAKVSRTSITKTDYQKLEQFHDKNLTLHRSMNTEFMKKQFSNSLFVTIFREFIEQMDQQFDQENEERINRFAVTISSAWIEQTISMVQYQKKLPWLESYKPKIKTIAVDLLKAFEHFATKAAKEE